jgi:hypothetical protein
MTSSRRYSCREIKANLKEVLRRRGRAIGILCSIIHTGPLPVRLGVINTVAALSRHSATSSDCQHLRLSADSSGDRLRLALSLYLYLYLYLYIYIYIYGTYIR